MKNCELFTTVQALHEAWDKRSEITKGSDNKRYLPQSILEWACFWNADTALDPKLKPGALVELTGTSISHYPVGSFGIVVRPRLGYLNEPITKLLVAMSDGKEIEIKADHLRPSKLPEGVMQLARNQLVEEVKALHENEQER